MRETTIQKVFGRRVWDSRGRPTVEAQVCTMGGAVGRAIAPAGASTGSGEAVDLRDGGARLGGYGVERAVNQVNGAIAKSLRGLDSADQLKVDQTLILLDGTPNKSQLGGNAMIAVSMAVAKAAAATLGEPLYRYLGGDEAILIPLPEIQIFGGGAHAERRVDVQDFMIVAVAAQSFDEALEMTAEVYLMAGKMMADSGKLLGVADEGGYWPAFDTNEQALEMLVRVIEKAGYIPGEQVAISLDIAASQFYREGRYRLGVEGKDVDSDGLGDLLVRWIDRYPIVAVEDPLAENDVEGFRKFTALVGHRVQVIGDDLLVTNAARTRAAGKERLCNAVLIKPNQAGTLSETRAALDAAREAGLGTIISARSGETEDTTIAHLAVGWNAGQLKVGSFARSERMAKWNEVLRIESELGAIARFARRAFLPTRSG
jgi:enolase 1/2/3